MLRYIIFAAVIGALAAPVHARGGASDEGHKRSEALAKKYKESGKTPPNLFDLLFGGEKKKTKQSK